MEESAQSRCIDSMSPILLCIFFVMIGFAPGATGAIFDPENLSKVIRIGVPDARVGVTNDRVFAAKFTQSYTITENTPRLGRIGAKIEGPSLNGYYISAMFGTGAYLSPLPRSLIPNLSTNAYMTWDYFFSPTVTNLLNGVGYVIVDCSFGREADLKEVSRVYSFVRSNAVWSYSRHLAK